MLVQLLGLVITSGITAVIGDALVSARLGTVIGGLRGSPKRHYVVVGLGRVGMRVARALKERGLSVVAVERSEDALGVALARELRIPVVIGESLQEATLRRAGVDRAQALVTVTDSDAANLRAGCEGTQPRPAGGHPDVRRRSRRACGAPARHRPDALGLAAGGAHVRRAAEVVVPVGCRVVVLAEFDLRADIAAARLDTRQVSRVPAVRQDGQWRWHPGTDEHFRAGDRIAVAATRSGMAAINQVLDEQS